MCNQARIAAAALVVLLYNKLVRLPETGPEYNRCVSVWVAIVNYQ